jgi:phosphatidylethanolamine-binding protein (PEBP) family uncharacterized protein
MLKYAFNLQDDGLVGQQLFAGEATRMAYMTDEAVEGRDSFLEKREPDWKPYPWYFWAAPLPGHRGIGHVPARIHRFRHTDHMSTDRELPAPEHRRPPGTGDDTVAALGKLSESLETVERARGLLY